MNHYLSVNRMKAPVVPKNFINREQLIRKIEDGLNKKIMILEAGAGNGKTTIVRKVLEKISEDNWKWLTFEENCNQLQMFWSYLVEVLHCHLGKLCNEVLEFFKSGVSEDTVEEMLLLLTNCLQLDDEFYLILDDFHFITNKVVLNSFEKFLEESPEQFHLILITRYRPEIYLARYLMDNELQYLGEDEFLLDESEGKQLIQQDSHSEIADVTQQQLLDTAKGWIGGLKMLIAARKLYDKDEVKLNSFGEQMLWTYLAKEIMNKLSGVEQAFLVSTACLPFVSQHLSIAILPEIDFARMITGLINKNLMITCIDSEEEKYVYHPLLKEYLVSRFDQFSKDKQKGIKSKAAAILIDDGEIDEGFSLLFELEEYQRIMDSILAQPQTLRTTYYISRIPCEIAVQNIDFSYQKIFYHYSNMNMEAELEQCKKMISILEETYPGAEEIKALGGFKLLLGASLVTLEQTPSTIQEINRLHLNDVSKGMILLKNALTHFYQDNFQQAKAFILASVKLNENSKNQMLAYFDQTLLAQTYEEIGEFHLGLQLLNKIYHELDTLRFPPQMKHNFQVSFFITITGIYLKQMDLEHAAQALKNADSGERSLIHSAYLYNYAELLYLKDEPEKALQIIEELNQTANNSYESPLANASLKKYTLKLGQLSAASQDEFIEAYQQHPELQNANNRLFYGLVLADRGEYEKALELANSVLAHSRQYHLPLKNIEANLLKLSILLKKKETDLRLLKDIYHECLYYSCENSILSEFFLYKDEIRKLEKLLKASLTEELESKELQFHERIMTICLPVNHSQLLTDREQEVLQQIAKGATNKEIAGQLYISLPTVKTHVLNLYRKLEVSSRISAVEKAKKLHII